MRDWLTTSELAGLDLPGFPATRQGWDEFAEREGWMADKTRCRLRTGRGGGLEYHVELLPAAALVAYATRAIGTIAFDPSSAVEAAADPRSAALTLPALEARDARLALIAKADWFARNTKLSRRMADRVFCEVYEAGNIEIDAWICAAVKKLSTRSLARWRGHLKVASPTRLGVDRGAARRGKGMLETAANGEVRDYILGLIVNQPQVTADHVRDAVKAKFGGLEAPPIRTFQHFLKGLKIRESAVLLRLTNPDAFKSRFKVSGTNSHPVSRVNELWMIDASPVDALCVDGRHSFYVCVDIFTRRLSVHVSRTPRAEAVAMLMRRAILGWGVPERVKTDNGSDFLAKATQRLFASLQIEAEAAAPFSPEQKGHVERAIGTLQRGLVRVLPGFIGHSVADRKIIESRRSFSARLGQDDAHAFAVSMTSAELQARCDDWANDKYGLTPHAGLQGQTPFAVAAAYPGRLRRIEDVRALDLLLAPIAGGDGLRVIGKTGLRINNTIYLTSAAQPGAQVFVRMDPLDLGRALVFAVDGETFLGEAVAPELAGLDPVETFMKVKAAQKAFIEEELARVRPLARKIGPNEVADAQRSEGKKNAAKLIAFPQRADSYETPALRAAGEATRDDNAANEPIEPNTGLPLSEAKRVVAAMRERDDQRATMRAEFERELLGGSAIEDDKVARLRTRLTLDQKMGHAREIEAQLRRGASVSDVEQDWFNHFRRQAEYIGGLKTMHERFRHVRFLEELQAMNVGPLWPAEERWLNQYVKTGDYQTIKDLFEEFGEEAIW